MNRFCFTLLILITCLRCQAQDGFCMVNGTTTGGAGGTVVTVTNGTDFNTQINIAGPRIIQVQGPITIGSASCTANKTIIGIDTNAALLGALNISGVSNVIVQNLRITHPGGDGITIRESGALPGSRNVWIDHVTFFDCGDGSCDISVGADNITVSWCKFIYPAQLEHRFTMIADGQAGNTNSGHITLHHNWWGHRSDQRMGASSYASVHYYNNYFNCTNNSYCSNARTNTEINSENNFYSGVKDPIGISAGTNGKIKTSGNTYSGCTGTIHPGTDTVFTPPYAYTLDATATVPTNVMAGAGAPGPESVVFPPKIWDGGGTSSNLNTANNWGFNEVPREYDTLVFAGSTRPGATNNFTANSEFRSLVFSSNAAAFVLIGNTLNLGCGITNDSANVQTLKLKLDLTYGADHYTMNRDFNVSSPSGSLVLNGGFVGFTNIYNKLYAVSKSGPGLLTLGGSNNFPGSFNFNAGLVRFSTATNLGTTNLIFNGGGLQWAGGNTEDISIRTVTINSGGATLDTGANDVLLASRIGNNGTGSLTKLGAGRLTINATNSYKGSSFIGQGTFALAATALLTNSPLIVVSNGATFDVTAPASGLLLRNGQTFAGNGLILGAVTLTNGATLNPGTSPGILTISNTLTLITGSTTRLKLDKLANTNDLITGLTSVTYGGNLVVTNLGGTLAANDSFKLFNAGSYTGSFNSITLPALTGDLIWTNKLALDGTLAVISPVNATPTNITFSVSGGSLLQMSWPTDHIGWSLQAQTNPASTGLGTNWFTLAGYETTNAVALPISPASPTVFYRLFLPQ